MAKYINAEDLRTALLQRSFYPAIVAYELEHMPAADVVPVVRCKDCRFAKPHKTISGKEMLDCIVTNQLLCHDDFCSYGERSPE